MPETTERTTHKYQVRIIERLETAVHVRAISADAAESMVRAMYDREEVVLTADDHADTEFIVIGKHQRKTGKD